MSLGQAASTIVVRITGDSKALSAAVGNANRTLSGLGGTAALKGVAIGAGIGIATAAVVDFGDQALKEGDRVGDALTRLQTRLDRDLVDAIDHAAGRMTHLGQSRQDVLELSAAAVEFGEALGVADDELAKVAPKASETAAALELLGKGDAAGNLDLINKAAGGSEKALRNLGVELTEGEVEARALADTGKDTAESLTDGEIAAARYKLILEKLAPQLAAVADGQGDVEQSTAELQAKWETLMGKIGEGLDGPLNDLLTWMLNGISGLEQLIGLLEKSPKFIEHFGDVIGKITAGPLDAMLDTLGGILKAIGLINDTPVTVRYNSTPNPDRNDSRSSSEASVVSALNDYASRNGLTIL